MQRFLEYAIRFTHRIVHLRVTRRICFDLLTMKLTMTELLVCCVACRNLVGEPIEAQVPAKWVHVVRAGTGHKRIAPGSARHVC